MTNFIPEGAEVFAVIYPEEREELNSFKSKHFEKCIEDKEMYYEEDCAPTHPVYVTVHQSSIGNNLRAICGICKEKLSLCCDTRVENT